MAMVVLSVSVMTQIIVASTWGMVSILKQYVIDTKVESLSPSGRWKMRKACNRCGYLNKLEKHHKKHKADGGSDNTPNRVWLCQGCHDYKHARDAVLKAIKSEKARLLILENRLSTIENANTPEQIKRRGYQPYFELYSEPLTPSTLCGRKAY